ncbi:MAG: hypothetical protein BWX70_03008 [Verrucomicrobia bacterium ADurb.Bin070]|nr:MAG: hypothetical protein BWX70_03008 [Verrucomicrobia bacterium ADurb.Bin070]
MKFFAAAKVESEVDNGFDFVDQRRQREIEDQIGTACGAVDFGSKNVGGQSRIEAAGRKRDACPLRGRDI